MTEEEIESWKRQQNRHCLQFDGASKNNPGKARARGIIFYPSGKTIVTYEWGLEQISNNKAETYSLFMGTKIIKKRGIQNPIILGDSAIIIQAMIQTKSPSNEFMSRIIKRIRRNLEDSGSVTFKHILRLHNQQADFHANQAVEMNGFFYLLA